MIKSIEESRWYNPEFEKVKRRKRSPAYGSLSHLFGSDIAKTLTEMWFSMIQNNDHGITEMSQKHITGYNQYGAALSTLDTYINDQGERISSHANLPVHMISVSAKLDLSNSSQEEIEQDERYWYEFEGFSFVPSASNMPIYMIDEMQNAAILLSALGILDMSQSSRVVGTKYLDAATLLTQIFWDDIEPENRPYFIVACYISSFSRKKSLPLTDLFHRAESLKTFHRNFGDNTPYFEGKMDFAFDDKTYDFDQKQVDKFVREGVPENFASILTLIKPKTIESFRNSEFIGYDWDSICLDSIDVYLIAYENQWSRTVMKKIAKHVSEQENRRAWN